MFTDEKTVYLVNPHGAVQSLPHSLALERLKTRDWRHATKEEISALAKRGGNQDTKHRIANAAVGRPGEKPQEKTI